MRTDRQPLSPAFSRAIEQHQLVLFEYFTHYCLQRRLPSALLRWARNRRPLLMINLAASFKLIFLMEVTCPICYDPYNDKEKIPRILSCGHTFCQNCLMDLRTSNILTCPTCRTYFSPDVK